MREDLGDGSEVIFVRTISMVTVRFTVWVPHKKGRVNWRTTYSVVG